jgi:hypothetical protein
MPQPFLLRDGWPRCLGFSFCVFCVGGEVGAVGAFDDGADDGFGEGLGNDGSCVGGGELEAVEEDCGAFGVYAVKGEGGDEEGDGDLDGFGVFEGGEVDLGELGGEGGGGVAGEESGRQGLAEDALALEEAGVEVAELVSVEAG